MKKGYLKVLKPSAEWLLRCLLQTNLSATISLRNIEIIGRSELKMLLKESKCNKTPLDDHCSCGIGGIAPFIPVTIENSTCDISSATIGTLFLCCVRV